MPTDSDAMKIAGEIVIAYLARATVDAAALPRLVREVQMALRADQSSAPDSADAMRDGQSAEQSFQAIEPESSPPDVITGAPGGLTAENSITDDYIICFEDGKPYRSLRRHLRTQHGLTPEEYRAKWALPSDYPMVAPSFARERAAVAKRIGLGGPRRTSGKAVTVSLGAHRSRKQAPAR